MILFRILSFICSIFLFSSITSCTASDLYEIADDVSSSSYAFLTVDFGESGSTTLTIENRSSLELEYSESLQLNIKYNDVWYDIPCIKGPIIEVTYGIPPGEEDSYELTLDDWFGPLNPGYYRIIKPIYGFSTQEFVVTEFMIE